MLIGLTSDIMRGKEVKNELSILDYGLTLPFTQYDIIHGIPRTFYDEEISRLLC